MAGIAYVWCVATSGIGARAKALEAAEGVWLELGGVDAFCASCEMGGASRGSQLDLGFARDAWDSARANSAPVARHDERELARDFNNTLAWCKGTACMAHGGARAEPDHG